MPPKGGQNTPANGKRPRGMEPIPSPWSRFLTTGIEPLEAHKRLESVPAKRVMNPSLNHSTNGREMDQLQKKLSSYAGGGAPPPPTPHCKGIEDVCLCDRTENNKDDHHTGQNADRGLRSRHSLRDSVSWLLVRKRVLPGDTRLITSGGWMRGRRPSLEPNPRSSGQAPGLQDRSPFATC